MRLFLIICVCLFSWAGNPNGDHAKDSAHAQSIGSQPSQKPITSLVSTTPQANASTTQQGSNDPRPWYKKPEWIAVLLTGIYVGFTIYYVIVSHLTLKEISGQAKTAQQSADAASDNAEALMNSERAWLDVRMVEQNSYLYDFRIKNHGKTPAHSVAIKIDFRHFTTPDDANTSTNYLASPRMWSGGEEYPICELDTQSTLGVQAWGEIHEGRRHLVIRGEISYRNVVGDSFGISGFCYNWNGASKEFERISSESFYK